MEITNIITPIIYGVIIFSIIVWFIYVIYWILKHTIFRLIKPKISDDIYEEVADMIIQKKKFEDIAIKFSKYPKKIQNKYIQAYFELKEIENENN